MNRQLGTALGQGLDAAVATPRSSVLRHVASTRRAHPDATTRDLLGILDRRYLATVASTGAASGAAAAAPGVGTAAALVLAGGDAVGFLAASALLAMSYAEIYDVPLEDLERRRTLIMAVMLGDSGAATVTRVAERTGAHWGSKRSTPSPSRASAR